MRFKRVALAVLLIIAVLAVEWVWLNARPDRLAGAPVPIITTQAAAPGGSFSLIDHDGNPFSDRAFRGEYLLMLFGYTFCPDVCPTTLNTVAAALDLLGENGKTVQPLFVTLDPERDTPAVLADYVAAFHPRIIGLTGSPEQIRRIAHDYRVYYAKAETGDENYFVDHSAYLYLIGPDGQTLTYLKHSATPEAMARAIGDFVTRRASRRGADRPVRSSPAT